MGTEVDVVLVGGDSTLLDTAQSRIAELEAAWSRFQPDSDISRLNAAHGRPLVVRPETVALIELAITGWRLSGGRFDPTVLPAVIGAGYDRTFRQITDSTAPPAAPAPAPGCAGIVLDRRECIVSFPDGVRFDSGGIGKGYAADLLATELCAAGAAGACVSLGGDVRVTGEPPSEDGWVIGVEHAIDPAVEMPLLTLAGGAVVTTTRMHRNWLRAGRRQHHLIDPARGVPAWTGLAAVTVVAGVAWHAEVLAKWAYLAGPEGAVGVLTAAGVTGIVVDDDGRVCEVDGLEAYVA